jgi:hypothetical protein
MSAAFGYVYGSTNLSFGYPSFSSKTSKPSKPYAKDEYSIQRYKIAVDGYVREAKEYVEAGNNDIKRVQEAKAEAIEEANRVVDEYNIFIRTGY